MSNGEEADGSGVDLRLKLPWNHDYLLIGIVGGRVELGPVHHNKIPVAKIQSKPSKRRIALPVDSHATHCKQIGLFRLGVVHEAALIWY